MNLNNPKWPTLQSHTHCQTAQTSHTNQSLSKSVFFLTHARQKKKVRLHNKFYQAQRNTEKQKLDTGLMEFQHLTKLEIYT